MSGQVSSNEFGLGNCCVSVCGMVPCDSQCSGKALKDMGSNVTDAFNELADEYKNLTDALKDQKSEINKFKKDYNNQVKDHEDKYRMALDAYTKAVLTVNTNKMKARSDIANTYFLGIKNIYMDSLNSKSVIKAENLWGKDEVPISGYSESAKVMQSNLVAAEQLERLIFDEISIVNERIVKLFKKGGLKIGLTRLLGEYEFSLVGITEGLSARGSIDKDLTQKNIVPILISENYLGGDADSIELAKESIRAKRLIEITKDRVSLSSDDLTLETSGMLSSSKRGVSLRDLTESTDVYNVKWYEYILHANRESLRRELVVQDAFAASIEERILSKLISETLEHAVSEG